MLKKLFVLVVLFIITAILPIKVHAALPSGFQKSTVVSGLNFPDALAQAPDGRIFILQKTGEVRIYKNGQLLANPLLTLPVDVNQEHGLLGIAFDPNFSSNHYIYLSYVNANPNTFRVSRFTTNGDSADPSTEKILLQSAQTLNPYHISGTVRFGPDGKLWISVGNNSINANSQDLSNIHGKILRINPDGSIPTDNPFYGLNGENGAIWAYGFRNPFRFNFLPDGRPIVGDVGEAATEEVDIIEKGGNYGWPNCEGPCSPPNGGYTDPIFSYPHNGGSAAIVGGFLYNGASFGSSFQNTYFYGDYAEHFIRYIRLDGGSDFVSDNAFDTDAGTAVDLMQGQDGNLYFVTLADSSFGPSTGALYKITYDATGLVPNVVENATPKAGLAPLKVTFSSDGSNDPAGNNLTFLWDFGDGSSSTDADPTHTYTQNGTFTAKLTVSNGNQTSSATTQITVGKELPVPSIITPVTNAHYNAGDTISFSGDATDAQDGNLPASDFTWSIIFHHQTHIHPFINSIQGVKSGTFVIPATGEPSAETSYEIILTVTDSAGLTQTVDRIIYPNVVNLNFNTQPVTGLTFTLDGIPHQAPYSVASVVGFVHTLDVPEPQTQNGFNYDFSAWSDGLAKSHTFSTPAQDANYIAGFDETPSGNGHLHYRIREIDNNGNWDGKFINGATAKLTDPTGAIVFQSATSQTINGQDGWVYFDNVPSSNYGALSYKANTLGVWKQTTCAGAGTTQGASISNGNTGGAQAAWQNTLKVVANQITWCADEGLKPVTNGDIALRVALIENDPAQPGKYISFNHINDATVKLTDSTGTNVIQTATTADSGGQDGWVHFKNVPAGTSYGIMAYKAGYTGFWKMTDCAGDNQTNSTIQNAASENIKAAWNNQVSVVAGVVSYCYDLGLQGSGNLHFRVREFNSSNTWTGKFINGATAKLMDPTGTNVIATASSKIVNGQDGWVYFDNIQAGFYGALSYMTGDTGLWRQTDCGAGGTTTGATIQNANTENLVAAWQANLEVPDNGQTIWCSDEGLINPNATQGVGHVHFRIREIDSDGAWNGKFINGATAKLTDPAGATVTQTATSQTVSGQDGWVYFDNVPAGNYGALSYKQGYQGAWKQTNCTSGFTTTDATIQNANTENLVAAWQNNIQIQANQVTWCVDEGISLIQSASPSLPTPSATLTPTTTPTPTISVSPTPTQQVPTPTVSPTPTSSVTPTPVPSSPTPTPTTAPSPTNTPSPSPTTEATPTP